MTWITSLAWVLESKCRLHWWLLKASVNELIECIHNWSNCPIDLIVTFILCNRRIFTGRSFVYIHSNNTINFFNYKLDFFVNYALIIKKLWNSLIHSADWKKYAYHKKQSKLQCKFVWTFFIKVSSEMKMGLCGKLVIRFWDEYFMSSR